MAIADKAYPFGLRDVKITPLGADGATPGALIDLPASQTFSFSDTEDFQTLRGDDTDIASHGGGARMEWGLESGGISLEAYAAMAGGAITTTGVTPSAKKTYSKLTTDIRPYFKVEGQAINDNGGDLHGVVYRCKATGNLEGQFGDGEFWVTKADGVGFGSLEATKLTKLYDFVQNETAEVIV